MTVIAYRDGVLASDSRVTSGKMFLWSDTCKKIFKLAPNMFLGLAGDANNGMAMLDQFQKIIKKKLKRDLPNGPFKNVEAILVHENEVWQYAAGWERVDKNYEYTAIGCGYVEAMTAMDTGATAVEAVKTTIKRNVFCGGRIQKLEIS